MHPIKELQKILTQSTPNKGTVVSAGENLIVATTNGTLSVSRNVGDATNYKAGDSVILANNKIIGRRLRASTIYVL